MEFLIKIIAYLWRKLFFGEFANVMPKTLLMIIKKNSLRINSLVGATKPL